MLLLAAGMRILLLTVTITTCSVMTAAAQSQPAQPATAATPGAPITVIGCVTRQSATPQTGAGTRGQAGPLPFLLTDQASPTPPSVPTDGTASSGATPTGGQTPRTTYVLVGHDDKVDLSKHVNHTVRVTGTSTASLTTAPLAGRSPEAAPVGGVTAPPGATGTAFDTSNLPTLTVTTLTMLSTTCK